MAVTDNFVAMAVLCGPVGTHGRAGWLNDHSERENIMAVEFILHKYGSYRNRNIIAVEFRIQKL